MATYNRQQLSLIANETGFLRDNLEKISIPFLNDLSVRTLKPIELFGSKIKALIERSACRDLYDVANMIDQEVFAGEELSFLRKTVLFYLAVGGSKPPHAIYTLHAVQSIQYRQIRANLIPVLRKKDYFDFEEAKAKVVKFIADLLSFTTKETLFIDNFNNGTYCPELLFEDENILSRIRKHPMAIWKTITHDEK